MTARFCQANVRAAKLKFLSDIGGTYRPRETTALVRELVIKPVHTPVCSPQSDDIAESVVKTIR